MEKHPNPNLESYSINRSGLKNIGGGFYSVSLLSAYSVPVLVFVFFFKMKALMNNNDVCMSTNHAIVKMLGYV